MTTPSPSGRAAEQLPASNQGVVNGFRPVSLKVTCLHLRHKLMYCDRRHDLPGMVDDSSSTRVFFCVKTQDSLGPDDAPVHPGDCKAGRACYCHGGPSEPGAQVGPVA
jgi:hypothetical protein